MSRGCLAVYSRQPIDRQGRIRLITIGCDDANEEKVAAIIEGLLGEKSRARFGRRRRLTTLAR